MDIEDYSNGCLSVEFRHLVAPISQHFTEFLITYFEVNRF